jgi:Spy/CpxP family protein refolding chaperone
MNFRKSIMLSVLIAGIVILPAAYAQEQGKEHPMRERLKEGWYEKREKNIQEIYSQLNLTEEQKKLLEENKAGNQSKRKAAFQEMRSSREALNQELMKPELNMTKINEIQGKLKAVQSQMADERLSSILAVRKILTVEQFSKFIELMDKSRERGERKSEEK